MKNKSITNYISIAQPKSGHQCIMVLSDSGRIYHLQVSHKDMKAFDKYIRKAKLGMSYKEILREELIKYINGPSRQHCFFQDKDIKFSDNTPEGQTVVGLQGKSTVLLQAAIPDAESIVLEGEMMPLQNISTRASVANAGEEKIVSKDELEPLKQAGFASTQGFLSQFFMQNIPEVPVSHLKPMQAAETRMIKTNQEQSLVSPAFEKNQANIKSLAQMVNQRAIEGGLPIKLSEMPNLKEIKKALRMVHPDRIQGQNSTVYDDLPRILSEMLDIKNGKAEVTKAGAVQLAIEARSEVAEAPVEQFGNLDLVSYTVPDGTTQIGSSAFESCKNLKEIIISDAMLSTSVPTSHRADAGVVNPAQEIVMPQYRQTSSLLPSHQTEAGESKQEVAKSKAADAKLNPYAEMEQLPSKTVANGAVDKSAVESPSPKSVSKPLMSLGTGVALLATGAVALGAVATVRKSGANAARVKPPAAENIAPPPANKPVLAKQPPVVKKARKVNRRDPIQYFKNM